MGSIPTDKEIIFRSKLPDITIPDHLALHSYCFQNLRHHPDKPCIIDSSSSKSYSYSEVHSASRHVAAGLHRLGIRQGNVIMLLLPNSKEFIFSFLAASFIGVISTTANPFYTPAEIKRQATAAGAKIVVTESAYVTKIEDLMEDGVQIVVIDDPVPENCIPFSELIASAESDLPEVEIKPDDAVALPYSSGTTGLPKGVILTHRGLITSVAQQVDGENPNLHFKSDDVVLCVLPLFHIYSLNSVLLCGLRAGSSILLMKKFDVVKMMELVEKYGVTIAPFVPPICVEIAKSEDVGRFDLSSVRMVMSGAAPMGKQLLDRLKEKLPNAEIGQGYGMTEAGPVLAMCLAFAKEPFEVKSGSCGTVVRNAELKIIDPETGISLPKNQPGEICIRGKQIMKGYLNDVEATERTIDKEGWLHTGDVGYVDNDDEMFIVDRLKEMIKYKGYQVAPAELEAMLTAHPDIQRAAVVSIEDELAGELPVAFAVRSNSSEITEDEIKKHIAKQVIFYKRIHKVFFVDSIPVAPSGKILRKELRAKLAAGYPNV